MEFIKRYWIPLAGAALVVAVVLFLLFRPDKLFVDDAVDESLDDAFAPATVAGAAETPTTSVPTTAAPVTTTAEPVTSATETTAAPAPVETPTTTTLAPTTTIDTGPVAVGTGQFYGIDHAAEGTSTVYEQDGRYVLRFEDDTDIQNGPDLYVWLIAGDAYEGGTPGDYIDLGKIKGNVGGQNYELPPEYDPTVHGAVLIWCLRFAVPFAAAPIA